MPRKDNTPTCDWVSDPEDKVALAGFFLSIKSRIGHGGSWDATCLQEAENFMVARGPPAKGAPKTAASIKGIWTNMKKVHEAVLLMKQKQYVGASGWTYDQDLGFSVDDDNRDAWKVFSKAHPVFKPFANKGWDLFDTVHDTIPTLAKGMNVHNPALPPPTSHPAIGASHLQPPSRLGSLSPTRVNLQLDDDGFSRSSPSQNPFSSQSTQPISDWSQSNYGSYPSFDDFGGTGFGLGLGFQSQHDSASVPGPMPSSSSGSAATAPPASSQVSVPATPSVGAKRNAPDDTPTPWSGKRAKTSGPDAIMSLGKSVDNIGSALRDCFMPKESSAVSPTKQVTRARKIAEEDMELGVITDEQRAILSLIFGGDHKTADAYVAEKTEAGRYTLTKILIARF
ncbi:hypothetical protein C8R46DRAFT_1105193 [Mycena filopes]|nr:hypothetical protein C8R46DRAFT_1140761 [Mycena filopes]KAJ7156763.1 hypothetical protein C8R46DRAFT_1115084 [Mycena filopes]KAJ7161650.1 hypothetical protein C8R46DRAFT_1105193 [Mycena filopes]